ncbi:hypothetical protein BZG36_04857 [Bifiguratus adelaidae]|uniref:ATP synthase subunit delta, mitochondrial n=1 Tax=Bifiguratus adelaidae TaxID=1938954 RepID=A0A261XVL0_9FUNG|nr:hypothetical protein BZG36_04857 [Bifiguratus adelaidae]
MLAAVKPARFIRGYASEAQASDRIRLNFVVPHQASAGQRAATATRPYLSFAHSLLKSLPQAIYKNASVQQVNIDATSGSMGVLANHVPSIEQLKPGIVEVLENANTVKKYFVSGGFATINPDSSLNINAVEAFPLEEFSAEAVKAGLAEAQKAAASNASEEEKAAAKVEVEVYEALQAALSK